MRILQAFEPATGGVPVHVEALTALLIERGHTVDVALSRHAGLEPSFERLGARTIPMDLVPEFFAMGSNARALAQLSRAIRSGGYDLVHLHGAKAGTLGRLAAKLGPTPAVYSSHDFVYRSQLRRERRMRSARRYLTLGIERALAPLTSVIVCVSSDERDSAIRDRVARPQRLRVAYSGVPLDGAVEPDRRLVELRRDGVLFGFMSRLQEQKGLPLLLAALARLRDRDRLPRFAIVGEGPLRSWVADRIAADGLGERVTLLPFEPPVGPKLAAFDVYVLSSYWESLPIGVLEAMAAGLPVIATMVNGIPEAVEDGVTGLLVPPDDPDALADAIDRMASDAALRTRMGEAGRRRCQARFTLDAMADSVEAIYRDVLAR